MAHRIDPDACVACGSCIDECPLGAISAGDVYSIDATCTSIREFNETSWNSITSWGPTALLPIFQILGVFA